MGRDPTAASARSKQANFRSRVLEVVSVVPAGRVVTYGQVALLAGAPGAARQVGFVLRAAGEAGAASELPWHRVVNARGALSTYRLGYGELQRALLEAEGVVFGTNGTLALERYRWWP